MSLRLAGCLAACLLLVSCGGGGSGNSGERINGIAVPPALPGPDKSSLLGVDSNANGVRDEVERSLATHYGARPSVHGAAMALASQYQQWLTKPADSQLAARALLLDAERAGSCLLKSASTTREGAVIANEVMLRVFSTAPRLKVRGAVLKLAGALELPEFKGDC